VWHCSANTRTKVTSKNENINNYEQRLFRFDLLHVRSSNIVSSNNVLSNNFLSKDVRLG
jgi:hypothetical protein